MSLKRILIFNQLKDKYDYSSWSQKQIEELIGKRYKDASKYLRQVCAQDIIKHSYKKESKK